MSWPTVAIGDIASLLRNGMSIKQTPDAGGLPITRIETIASGIVNLSRCGYAGLDREACAGWLLQEGDILISHINSMAHLGKCAIYEKRGIEVVHGMNLLNFRVDPRVAHPRYILHALRSKQFIAQISTIVKKSVNQASFNISTFKGLEIPLPPLEEQRRIAAILDVVDELCRKRQRALHCLSQLGQAIFIEMFGDLLLSNEQAVALGEVCDVRDGTHDSPKYVDAGFPLLTSKNFSSGSIDYTGAKLIAEADFTNINKRSRVDKGDIVMPMIGTIGGPVIVDFDPDFAIKNVALIKFTDSPMNPEFIREALDGRLFRSHVASLGRGGTQKFISLGDIRCFKIPLPSVSQQNLFARRVCRLRAERARHSQALKISEALFSSLQYRALSGELEASRLKDADL